MQESTILNGRPHVGLQKLSALSAIGTQFVGPYKHYKLIQDEVTGESALVSSCFRVLGSLELTCAVGQLVYETIEAHHKIYRTGSGCLLFMAGAWSQTALQCFQMGIPVEHIISTMLQGLDRCLSVSKQYIIPTEEFNTTLSKKSNFSLGKPSVTNLPKHKSSFISRPQKLKLSRHFCDSESKSVSVYSEKSILADIAKTLSHGCSDAMDLVVKVSQIQSTFDVTKISTCLLPGLAEACVLPGCVVLVSMEQALVAHRLNGQELKVALINGDLTPTYHHLGFNKPKALQRVSDFTSSENTEEEWLDRVLRLVLKLEVKVLLISGIANEKLMDHCWRHDILIVEKVKLSVLRTFAASTGALLLFYATQLNSKCAGLVTVKIWRDLENKTALNISTGQNNELVTAVLTSCVRGKLQSLEDQFWACAYRLHWAMKDSALLPGAGVLEMGCIHKLQNQHHNSKQMDLKTTLYTDLVLQLMADGLIDYICTVMVNTGEYSKLKARTVVTQQLHEWDSGNRAIFLKGDRIEDSEKTICDNVTVKQEAWRKALDLVFLVLQTDVEVVTGVGQKRAALQGDLMFL